MNQLVLVILLTSFVYLLVNFAQKDRNRDEDTSINQIYITNSGHTVRSYGEKAIADFLQHEEISFIYEMKLYGLKPDFYLPKYHLVIEYFGLAYAMNDLGDDYRHKMKFKIRKYAKNNQLVLSLFSDDITTQQYKNKIRSTIKALTINS